MISLLKAKSVLTHKVSCIIFFNLLFLQIIKKNVNMNKKFRKLNHYIEE